MDELKVINILDSFSTNALAVLVPLLLLWRGVSVIEIGLVISLSPIVFVISRGIFAAASDQVGVRKFFILNGFTNILAVAVYTVANSPLLFSIGKIVEGVRNGAVWAVLRTAVINKNGKEKAAIEMSKLQAERTAAAAVGIVVVGALLSALSFNLVLVLFLVFGVAILAASFLVREQRRSGMRIREMFVQLDFRKSSDLLKRTSFVMVLYAITSTVLLSLVLPVFLEEIGYDYWLIGTAIALFYTASAVTTFVIVRRKLNREVVLFGGVVFLVGAVLIPLLGGVWAIPMILLMGIGDGVSTPVWEMIIFNALRSGRDYSSDVALLQTLPNALGAVGVMAAGFLISGVGYWAVFASCGAFALLFFYFAFSLLRESRYLA